MQQRLKCYTIYITLLSFKLGKLGSPSGVALPGALKEITTSYLMCEYAKALQVLLTAVPYPNSSIFQVYKGLIS